MNEELDFTRAGILPGNYDGRRSKSIERLQSDSSLVYGVYSLSR